MRYLPANPFFSWYLLHDLDIRKKRLSQIICLSDVMSVLLDLIFAGKEKEGWLY